MLAVYLLEQGIGVPKKTDIDTDTYFSISKNIGIDISHRYRYRTNRPIYKYTDIYRPQPLRHPVTVSRRGCTLYYIKPLHILKSMKVQGFETPL